MAFYFIAREHAWLCVLSLVCCENYSDGMESRISLIIFIIRQTIINQSIIIMLTLSTIDSRLVNS